MATLQLNALTSALREIGLPAAPWIVGHRGAPTEAPENSLASFRHAVEIGVDAIELDVQLTADGRLPVVHDWELDRLAGLPAVIETSTWNELRPVRLLATDGSRSQAHIPRLEEVFEVIPETVPINVELKCRKSDPAAFLDAICPLLDHRDRCWVSSFDWDLLRGLHRRRPAQRLAPLTSRRRRGFEPTAARLGAVALHCSLRALSDALLRRAGAAGRPVLVYTVDDPAQAKSLFERGVTGVFTNEARLLRRSFPGAR